MIKNLKRKNSNEELILIAKKYSSKRDWEKSDRATQAQAKRRGEDFYNLCTAHMERP